MTLRKKLGIGAATLSTLAALSLTDQVPQNSKEPLTQFSLEQSRAAPSYALPAQYHAHPVFMSLSFESGTVDDTTLLAALIYGEGRDCTLHEQIAIAYTALNRQKEKNVSLKEVILEPNAYSFFNRFDQMITFVPDEYESKRAVWGQCQRVAQGVLSGDYADPTNGATFYFNPKKVSPSWKKKLEHIPFRGKHKFYKKPTA